MNVNVDFYSFYRFAVCYVIIDPSSGKAHNIVAAINVGPSYHAKIASPVSNNRVPPKHLKPKRLIPKHLTPKHLK